MTKEQLSFEQVKDLVHFDMEFPLTELVHFQLTGDTFIVTGVGTVDYNEVQDFLDYLHIDYTQYTNLNDLQDAIEQAFLMIDNDNDSVVPGLYLDNGVAVK